MKNELIMLVEESVYAQGDDLAALRSNVKDALLCHFGDQIPPAHSMPH